MSEKIKTQMELIFNATTIQIFNLFRNCHHHNHKRPEYINNIAGIAENVGLMPKTVRKHLTPMVEMGILKEVAVGKKGMVFVLEEGSAVTKALTALMDALDGNKIENLITRRNNKKVMDTG